MQKTQARQTSLVVRGVPPNRVGAAKKKKNKNKKSGNATQSSLGARRSEFFGVSRAGKDYMQSVLDPRSGPLCRVPWGYPVRSRVLRLKSVGTFTSGAGGIPFVMFNPWRMIASDDNAIWYSGSTYVSDASTAFDSSLTGVTSAGSNSDYTKSSLNIGTVMFRLVAASLHVSATSSLTARAGSIAVYTDPSHANLIAQNTAAIAGTNANSIMASEACRVQAVPMDNSEVRCVWGTPETPAESEFMSYFAKEQDLAVLTAAGATAAQSNEFVAYDPVYAPWYSYNMTIFSDASATNFRFEAYAIFEITGPKITGQAGGCIDTAAYGAVAGFMQSTPGVHATVKGKESTLSDVASWALSNSGLMDSKGNFNYNKAVGYAASAGKVLATLL